MSGIPLRLTSSYMRAEFSVHIAGGGLNSKFIVEWMIFEMPRRTSLNGDDRKIRQDSSLIPVQLVCGTVTRAKATVDLIQCPAGRQGGRTQY